MSKLSSQSDGWPNHNASWNLGLTINNFGSEYFPKAQLVTEICFIRNSEGKRES